MKAFLAILLFAWPTFAQLTVSPERSVSAPSLVPTDGAWAPTVVSSGDLMVVLWMESRDGHRQALYAARVTMEGELLDPTGMLLSSPAEYAVLPQAVWDGRDFVIKWAQGGGAEPGTHLIRMNRDGEIVQRNRLATVDLRTMTQNNGRIGAVTSHGGGRCSAGELDAELRYTPLIDLDSDQCSSRIAARGDGFILLWTAYVFFPPFAAGPRAMHFGSRTTSNTEFELSDLWETGGGQPFLDLATSGSDTIVMASTPERVALARIRADGTVETINPLTRPALFNPHDAIVGRTGGSFDLLENRGAGGVTLHRYGPTGWRNRGVTVTSNPDNRTLTGVAGPGDSTFVVTSNGDPVGHFVFGRPGTIELTRRAERQERPALSRDNDGKVLAVWVENQGHLHSPERDVNRIMGAMMNRDGSPAGAPFIVDSTTYGATPAVAFDGQAHVIVWTDRSNQTGEVRARWLGSTGGQMILTSQANPYARPAVASDGVSTVAAYSIGWPAPTLVVRPLTGPAVESQVPGGKDGAAMASNGERYLVVANSVAGGIRSALVDRSGNVLRHDEIAPAGAKNPSVAWNGSVFLVAYERDNALYGTLVGRDGTPGNVETRLATPSAGALEEVHAIWDGATFLVAFTLRLPVRSDVHARRIDASGNPQEAVIAVSKTPLDEGKPALASLGGGASMIAYSRVDPQATGTLRVFTRNLGAPKRRAVR